MKKSEVTFRNALMFHAHQVYRNSQCSWQDAMFKAWKIYYCCRAMRDGAVKFYYKKKDGSQRCAFGTLKDLPKPKTGNDGDFNPAVICYYDLERDSWRSFKAENFIGFYNTWKINKPQKTETK